MLSEHLSDGLSTVSTVGTQLLQPSLMLHSGRLGSFSKVVRGVANEFQCKEMQSHARGWASSRIANPLSLKANLDPTGLANPVSNPVSKLKPVFVFIIFAVLLCEIGKVDKVAYNSTFAYSVYDTFDRNRPLN